MAAIPVHNCILNTGAKMPAIGLGCWLGMFAEGEKENTETYDMVRNALKVGYRHIDTAFGYGNEEAVGRGIRDSGIPRSEIFVTTKLTGKDHGRVASGFENSFKALDIGYIDLYLMHWPQATDPDTGKTVPKSSSPTFNETWAEMEKLVGDKCKAIGVSNFSVKTLTELLKTAKTTPAVNQVECSVYLPQMSLDKFCSEKGIVLTAYSPLGQPRPGTNTSPVLTDSTIAKLAEKYGKPAGTVILSWLAQRPGWNAIPKSSNPSRMKANLEIFKLDDADFEALSKVHTEPGKLLSTCGYGEGNDNWRERGTLFGWTLEEMGWEIQD